MLDTGSQGRILVVDDEPDLVTILTRYFSEAGYAVDAAAHGGDALIAVSDSVKRDLVVALHHDLGAELAEVLDEVVGEAVVVVDDEDHAAKLTRAAWACRGGGCG